MRSSTAASIVRRLIKSVAEASRSFIGSVVEGAMPAPQPIPVRVRATRRS
ncbi:hypothetical protein [Methylobacterium sp.]|jgi:hypothetical protein|nr:hypothetical protein [Methylobacterium sp.]MDB5645328.1 hypothetical protein [Methylobacterium sp.]